MRNFLIISFLCFSLGLFSKEKDGTSEIIVIPLEKVHKGDFFARGKTIEISGKVEGDAFIFGSQIFIDGEVTGDVIVSGGNVHISGKVGQSVRALAGQISVGGNVGRNIAIIAGNAEFSQSAKVGGSITVIAGNLNLGGFISQNANLFTSNVRVSDQIQGNLKIYSTQMRLTSKAYIGGNLDYYSNTEALIDPYAVIRGKLINHPSFFYTITQSKFLKGLKIGSKFAGLTMNFLYSFVIGILLLYFFSPKVEKSLYVLSKKPFEAFIYGLLVLILLPLISLMLLMTILGVPFGLTLLAVNIVGFYTAKIISILWMVKTASKKIGYDKHKKLYFSLGLIAYFFLISIPILGWIIALFAMLFGIGAITLGGLEVKNLRGHLRAEKR